MVQFAYATARSSRVEPFVSVRPVGQGAAPRRVSASNGAGFDLGRRITLGLVAMALLVVIGWVAARTLDSTLLGFVFADLVFLVGVALRSAVSPARGPHSRTR